MPQQDPFPLGFSVDHRGRIIGRSSNVNVEAVQEFFDAVREHGKRQASDQKYWEGYRAGVIAGRQAAQPRCEACAGVTAAGQPSRCEDCPPDWTPEAEAAYRRFLREGTWGPWR